MVKIVCLFGRSKLRSDSKNAHREATINPTAWQMKMESKRRMLLYMHLKLEIEQEENSIQEQEIIC